MVARRTSNPEAVGSSPTWSAHLSISSFAFFDLAERNNYGFERKGSPTSGTTVAVMDRIWPVYE